MIDAVLMEGEVFLLYDILFYIVSQCQYMFQCVEQLPTCSRFPNGLSSFAGGLLCFYSLNRPNSEPA